MSRCMNGIVESGSLLALLQVSNTDLHPVLCGDRRVRVRVRVSVKVIFRVSVGVKWSSHSFLSNIDVLFSDCTVTIEIEVKH